MTTRLTITNDDAITAMRACRKAASANGADGVPSLESADEEGRKQYADLACNLARRLRARGVASVEIEKVLGEV